MSIRLPPEEFVGMDALCREGYGKVSYNQWVVEAIREKVARDSVREPVVPEFPPRKRTFYEFFAGGGMARLGMGADWHCLFANDIDQAKARAYRQNWDGGQELVVGDINDLTASILPGEADLVWASFPCQDLSLAGKAVGIGRRTDKKQTRSGTFWPFWNIVSELRSEGRLPKVVVLENVLGVITGNAGKDFTAIGSALANSGYKFGILVIDAKYFVPQSRPRVFVVAIDADQFIDPSLMTSQPKSPWHTRAVGSAFFALPLKAKREWIWWNLPEPASRDCTLADLVEDDPSDVKWHTDTETEHLLEMMSPTNLRKVEQARRMRGRIVGTVYRRTRMQSDGSKAQRAEVRFDGLAGCLRTPSGGSSRQLVLVIENDCVRSRLLSAREAARLMALPEDYKLPRNYNDAYYLAGDGVVVSVVHHLAEHLLAPLIDSNRTQAILPLSIA